MESIAKVAWRAGVREAFAAPIWVLGVGYLGFGSLAQAQGLGLANSVLSTVSIWALPGQLILVEMNALSAPYVAIVLAVALSAARFLPMTVALLPHLRAAGGPGWRYYAAAHVLAMTSWAVAMRRYPSQSAAERLPFFFGFALTMWVACMGFTTAGYLLAHAMPRPLTVAFVFSNPIYFILILTTDLRSRDIALALLCGAFAGPLVHLVAPQWSVVGGGVVGGSVAFALTRGRTRG